MSTALYSEEHIAELRQGIAANEQHLADCEAHRLTPYLQGLHDHWSGKPVVNFDYLAGLIRYSQEENKDNLSKAERFQSTGEPGLKEFTES